MLAEELSRFREYLTGLKAHPSDENSSKESMNDKGCLPEIRLEGRQAVAVTGLGNTCDAAVNRAIDKLTAS